jgi:hypothetical protein
VTEARAHLPADLEPATAPPPPICAPPVPVNPTVHPVAVCRWCGGRFYLAHRLPPQWLCLTQACADRQVRSAIPRITPPLYEEGTGDQAPSPWLFLPLPLSIDLAESPWKRTLLAGAAGCAKSYSARWMAYRECLARPGIRVLLMRQSFDSLKKNHTQFMAAEALALQTFGHGAVRFLSGQYQSCSFENGSTILMGYCATESDVQKHLGNDLDLIIMEEAVLFPSKAIVEIPPRDRASPTARALGATDGKTWLLSNPGGQAMLTLSEFYIEKKPDPEEYPNYDPQYHGYIHGGLEDNPYLAPDYAEKNLGSLSAARYKQLRHGDWTCFAGAFFDFDQTAHVRALPGIV